MHVCETFREQITEQIIERHDLINPEFQHELLVCNKCAEFFTESREMMDALSAVQFEVSDDRWDAMVGRLRDRLLEDQAMRNRPFLERIGLTNWSWRPYAPAIAGALAILVVSIGIYRYVPPMIEQQAPLEMPIPMAEVPSLDPVTVQYLEQSELLLRQVMKLRPADAEDLSDAQRQARKQLIELGQRKEAASKMDPIVNAMDKYEMILRELRSLDRPRAEDLTDIQNRIERNGLIASMKSFQPRLNELDSDRGNEH